MKNLFAPFTKLFHYSIIVSCQPMVYGVTKHRGMEQLVARRAHNPKVRGSSPLPATKKAATKGCSLYMWVGARVVKGNGL